MDKLYAGARALAVVVAVVAAFVTIPYLATILLVLGAISSIGNDAERNKALFLATIVLLAGSALLKGIPAIGDYLATIFGGIGTAAVGASMMAIALTIYRLTMEAFAPKAAA